MKRFLKIFLGVIVGLFLLLLILPFAFKGKIETMVKELINEELEATVAWDGFSVSLIRNFPNLGVGMEGLSVVNAAPFAGDTLLYVGRFSASVDVMSALRGAAIDVKSVLIDRPLVHLKVNADSLANWDIVPMSEEVEEVVEEEGEAASFGVQLQSFEIRDAALSYSDATMDFKTALSGFNARMKGDMTEAYTTLSLQSSIEALDVLMEGVKYVNAAPVDLRADVGADLENMVFTFEDNALNFSGLPLFMEGTLAMLEEGFDMDLRLAASETSFKTILALVPKEYMSDLAGLETAGGLTLEATAKGVFVDADHLPAFKLLLEVKDGRIQYPDLPKSIDDIQVHMLVDNPGGTMDATVTDISRFGFSVGNNPFGAQLRVTTPLSNATFKGGMKGTIDFASLAEAFPMDSVELKGVVNADLTLDGDYEMIEQERYEDLKANGVMDMKDFAFRSPDLPMGVLISGADLFFSPQYLELRSFNMQMGESDFSLTGRLENYLAYALQDGTLKGKLEHASRYINTNELMALASGEEEVVEEEETPMGKVLVPANIDFTMTTKIDKLLYDKLTLENTQGALVVKDARVVMNNVRTQLLQGNMVMNGEYNTQDTLKPFMDFDLAVNTVDINQAAHSFSMVESFLPVARNANGRISTKMKFSSLLGDDFSPILSTFNGGGQLSSKEIEVSGAKAQTALVSLLKDEKYAVAKARDFLVNFRIDSGNVYVDPFDVNVFGKNANISGRQGLDKNMDFLIKMPVSRNEINSVAGFLGTSLPAGEDVLIGINITGTPDDPKLSLNAEALNDVVKDEVKKAAEKVGEELKKEAEKAVEKLMEDPETKEKIEEAGKKLRDLFR